MADTRETEAIGQHINYLHCVKGCTCKCHQIGADCDECSLSFPKLRSLRAQLAAAKQEADLWETIAKLGRYLMKCGHQEMYAHSYDGGKNRFCLLCHDSQLAAEKQRADALEAALKPFADWGKVFMRPDTLGDSCPLGCIPESPVRGSPNVGDLKRAYAARQPKEPEAL